ncbi:hypothetical protein [Microtetraspora sp. NBRC 16547]|uniref:hypothetical protein n=1 Tax=Microtetraspora sp. NBRC 16547 TaxID=3030993 RepID=UPI0024A49D8A|nr:hypothetical protein [Microtetraspora sp. NBRC 16547]GLW97900.1 hypothetical protein Misp02_19870 [Microtetraspora sp. NBRC 16547]
MRIIGGAICAASCLLAALAGCGADANNEQRAALDSGRLKVLLSGIEDMPQGFSDRQRERWRPPFRAKDGDCRVLFDAVAGRPPGNGLLAGAATTYEGDHLGEAAAVGLAVYGEDAADGELDRMERTMRGCRVAAAGGAGKGNRLRASNLSIPDVGDAAEARRFRGRVGGYPYEMHLVVARKGNALITLLHGGVRPLDPKGTKELARVLAGRVSTLDL